MLEKDYIKSLNSDGSTDYNVATADDVSLNSITTNNSKMGTVTVEQNVFDDRGNSIIMALVQVQLSKVQLRLLMAISCSM